MWQLFYNPDKHSDRFDYIHVNIGGPLPPSQGFWYVFRCMDRFIRWPEVMPAVPMMTEDCARMDVPIGIPSTIVSDQGREFEFSLWSTLDHLISMD